MLTEYGKEIIAVKEMFVEMNEESDTIELKITENKRKYLILDMKHKPLQLVQF